MKPATSRYEGEQVAALKKIVYLPSPPETGPKIVLKGIGGVVLSRLKRRTIGLAASANNQKCPRCRW